MPRPTVIRIHLAASVAALAIVATFLVSSAAVEVFGDESAIRAVKTTILATLVVLIPIMAVAGVSGRRLAGRSRAAVVRRKLRRMKAIGATGLLVLVPCAIALERLAGQDDFGLAFAAVQGVELLGGTLNLTLLILNLRDGMALRAKRTASAAARRRRTAELAALSR
jgi:hypothetical protein